MKNTVSILFFILVSLFAVDVFALDVAATLPDLAAISKAVGGSKTTVHALAKPNEDPHHVDPSPNKIIILNKADVLVTIGLELEDAWLKPLVKQARNNKINIGGTGRVITSEVISLIDKPQGKIERSEGDIHPGGNPHFNFDPRAAAKIAVQLQKKFAQLDPENAAVYAANTKNFLISLRTMMKKNYQRFQALPASKREIVTYHKSLGYLLNWLGIREIENVEPKPGIPPNPAHMAAVLNLMKRTDTKVVVQEKFYPRSTSQTLVKLLKGELVLIDGNTDFKEEGGETYISHISKIGDAIYTALNK